MKLSSRKLQQGFSLIELVIVVAVMLIVSSMAIMSTMRPSTAARANNAADSVVDTLRQGRLLAITKRRNVLVTLTAPNQIQLTVQTLPGEAAPPSRFRCAAKRRGSQRTTVLSVPHLAEYPHGSAGFRKRFGHRS